MKKAGKILALICSFALIFGSVACGGDDESYSGEVIDEENDVLSGTIKVRVWDGGFGYAWLDNVIAAFNEKYPDVKIKIDDSVERQQVFGDIIAKNNKYDVIISESQLVDYTDCLENLDDVYAYTNKGETKSVSEKIISLYREYYLNRDGHYYQLPAYVGAYGLVYDNEYIYDDEIPVTTEELKTLCNNLKGIKPFIFSGETGTEYWNFIYCTWFAQYEGREAYSASLLGKVKGADGEYRFDPSAAYLEGGLKAMQVCEDLLWYDNGYIKNDSTGLQFIVAQREFLQGKSAAMMYNGSWMMNEMQLQFPNGTDHDYKMMKVPVISAIRDKCPTIADDKELAALVRAIDGGSTALSGSGYDVSAEDFNRVKDARGFFYAGSEGASSIIPINARNKALAKRFLSFMYSSEGIMKVAEAKAGNIMPVTKDCFERELTTSDKFLSSVYKIMFNSDVFFNNPMIAVTPYCTVESAGMIEKQFGSQKEKDRTRAIDSFNAKKTSWTKDDNDKFWSALISKGLIKSKPQ